MAEIILKGGRIALVDDEDLERISQWRWTYRSGYAGRRFGPATGQRTIMMHREVLQYDGALDVDHINGDRLDNRRSNLRLATRAQNIANGKDRRNETGYRGVWFDKRRQYYGAKLTFNRAGVHVGRFRTAEEAARAYDAKAFELFGAFARLNFPNDLRSNEQEPAAG